MEFYYPWLIWLVCMIAVMPSIIWFLKTPPAERYKFKILTRAKSIKEQLENLPSKAEAVVIKASGIKAIKSILPWYLPLIPIALFSGYLKLLGANKCQTVFGLYVDVWWLIMFLVGMPAGLLIFSIFNFKKGLKTIKTGYYPPLDSQHYRDIISKKGISSTAYGYLLVIFSIITVILAVNVFISFHQMLIVKVFLKLIEV